MYKLSLTSVCIKTSPCAHYLSYGNTFDLQDDKPLTASETHFYFRGYAPGLVSDRGNKQLQNNPLG